MTTIKEPLYATIARELAQRIASGEFTVGDLLPTEMELCEAYQASRHTIREALRELSEAGLVSRKKRAGTRVEEKQNLTSAEHSMAFLEDLNALAQTHVRVVKNIEEIVADQLLAETIGCEPGSKWLHIVSIRENSNDKSSPVCLTSSYVNLAYSEIGKLVQQYPLALISDLIEQKYGRRSTEVRQIITAILLSEEQSHILNAPVGSAALKIIRYYMDRFGKVFETTVSVHPADRYVCSISLKRVNLEKIS
ncbi:DNA-binding GntR family transcriptional regulator [Cricetibacter osteomyelitidis]|uniref:DNA-binding GntR family transcriptional regulator n=1 Tax=Cricetibacter osteomyelitidis TaxID=1521931 RepID=A0A4R2SY79_9PAST|nr:GntR family transcriptional regulator [Cricetibacter osteomyelitidis]TCP93444.1 DNA-binding GntR family transcriptional regulator [Cricetibacter osteomyelitidis]